MSNNLKKFLDDLIIDSSKEILTPDERYSWVVKMIENPKMVEEFINAGDPSIVMDVPYFETKTHEVPFYTSAVFRESFHIIISERFIVRFQNYVQRMTVSTREVNVLIIGTAKIIDVETGCNRFLFSYVLDNRTTPLHGSMKELNVYYLEDIRGYLNDLWLHKKEVAHVILDITREHHAFAGDTQHKVVNAKQFKDLLSAMQKRHKRIDIFNIIKPYKIGNYL